MNYRFVSMTTCSENDFYSIITIKEIPGFFSALFGSKPRAKRFRGNGTVWHDTETGRRAGETGNSLHDLVVGSTLTESYLYKIWNRERKATAR